MERKKKPIISGLFVFEQKKQRREICKTCFFFEKKVWEAAKTEKQKENKRDKQQKGWRKGQNKKHPNKGMSSKTIGESKKHTNTSKKGEKTEKTNKDSTHGK